MSRRTAMAARAPGFMLLLLLALQHAGLVEAQGSGLSSRVKEIVADLEAWEGRLQEMEQRAVRAEAEEKKLRAENAALRMAATTGTAQPPPPVAEVPATSSYSTSYSKTPGAVTADPAADEAKPKTLAKIMIFVVVALLLILVAAVGWKKYSDQLRRKELDRMKRMENEPMDAWPDPGLAFVGGGGGGGGMGGGGMDMGGGGMGMGGGYSMGGGMGGGPTMSHRGGGSRSEIPF